MDGGGLSGWGVVVWKNSAFVDAVGGDENDHEHEQQGRDEHDGITMRGGGKFQVLWQGISAGEPAALSSA
jgi:hypothetical protein